MPCGQNTKYKDMGTWMCDAAKKEGIYRIGAIKISELQKPIWISQAKIGPQKLAQKMREFELLKYKENNIDFIRVR